MSAHNAERRLLLSEDDERQIWLDLETGEQVEVPLDHPPQGDEAGEEEVPEQGSIMAVVLTALEQLGFRYQMLEAAEVSLTVRHRNLTSQTRILADESSRSVRVVSHLPIAVPPRRRLAVCEAAMRLMCDRTAASVLVNLDVGEVQVTATLMLENVEPTPELLVRYLFTVLRPLDLVFPVLVAVGSGLANAGDTQSLANHVVQGLCEDDGA